MRTKASAANNEMAFGGPPSSCGLNWTPTSLGERDEPKMCVCKWGTKGGKGG